MEHPSPGQHALTLASNGRVGEALAYLDRLTAAGDAQSAFMLGLWTLEGRLLPRDTARARQLFLASEDAGYRDGARVAGALLATGIGGAPDWSAAIELLERWSARDEAAARQLDLIAAMRLTPEGDPLNVPAVETLSEGPYVASIAGLFSPDECRFLVDLAQPRLRPALIFHEARQAFVQDPIRQSDAAGFPFHLEWPAIHALNRRIAAVSGTRVEQGETLQVLSYRPGQRYRRHFDAVPGLSNQRHLTVIVYLTDDYDGGETRFPKPGLSVRGRLGDGLLFRNILPDGRPDSASEHEGGEVTRGVKLIASRWIRQRPPEGPDVGFGRHEIESSRQQSVPAR